MKRIKAHFLVSTSFSTLTIPISFSQHGITVLLCRIASRSKNKKEGRHIKHKNVVFLLFFIAEESSVKEDPTGLGL
jgi:hypothetical protein